MQRYTVLTTRVWNRPMLRMFLAVLWTAFTTSAVISLWSTSVAPLGVDALIVAFPVAGALFVRDAWQRLHPA
ncbi:MAG: hypothetical protein AAFM92_08130 [Pseudomonadota bacterium]